MQLIDAKTTGVILGVHHRTVLRLFFTGEIEAMRVGPKLWRTTREAVEAYIQRGMATPPQPRPTVSLVCITSASPRREAPNGLPPLDLNVS